MKQVKKNIRLIFFYPSWSVSTTALKTERESALNALFVQNMMPNGQSTPTVVGQSSGDPVSALQLSTIAQHEQPSQQ